MHGVETAVSVLGENDQYVIGLLPFEVTLKMNWSYENVSIMAFSNYRMFLYSL